MPNTPSDPGPTAARIGALLRLQLFLDQPDLDLDAVRLYVAEQKAVALGALLWYAPLQVMYDGLCEAVAQAVTVICTCLEPQPHLR